MKTEQDANASERKRLGRALGTGVIEGLFVRASDDPKTLRVQQGLALAPSGRVVELPKKTEVSVVSSIEREETAGTKGQFEDCALQTATITTGTGAYLLVVEPAEETRGRVPRTRLQSNGTAGACGAQYRLEGASLRLVYFDPSDPTLVPPKLGSEIERRSTNAIEARDGGAEPAIEDLSMLRNLLAHACLRTATTAGKEGSLADAFRGRTDQSATYGPVDELRRSGKLSEDAVPIGLLYWLRDRIEFVDVWSVRRRVHHRNAQAFSPASDRRRAEAEATVFQFHEHIDALRAHDYSPGQISAERLFAYLPPIGMIAEGGSFTWPLAPPPTFPTFPTDVPFELPSQRDAELPQEPAFFDALTVAGPSFVEPQRLRALADEMLKYPPLSINPSFPPDPSGEGESGPLVWLYLLAPDSPQEDVETPFLFTTGYAPFLGDAQFDLSRANRATFSSNAGPPGGG